MEEPINQTFQRLSTAQLLITRGILHSLHYVPRTPDTPNLFRVIWLDYYLCYKKQYKG